MDATGTFPLLTDNDTVYTLKAYSEALAASLGQGGAWTGLAITNTAAWKTVAGYPVQIKAVGKLVSLRGMVAAMGTGIQGTVAVTIPVALRPSNNIWLPTSFSTSLQAMPLVGSNGTVQPLVTGYYAGTPSVGAPVSLSGSWLRD